MQRSGATAPFLLDTANYRCLECGTLFTSESAIEAHIQKFHAANFGFNCPHCQRSYKDNWHLNRHIITHGFAEGEEPKVVCTMCGKGFRDSLHLTKHQTRGRCQDATDPDSLPDRDSHILSEWTEEPELLGPPSPFVPSTRPVALSMVPPLYFCKVCGESLVRLKFSIHVAEHFSRLYPRRTTDTPVQVKGTFLQQLDDDFDDLPAGACRRCGINRTMVGRIKQSLLELRTLLPPTQLVSSQPTL